MRSILSFSFALAVAGAQQLELDINSIAGHWGQITPYHDNPENHFGVGYTGLPDGCQIEQAHLLQRHAQRFPTGSTEDGANNERFASKLFNFTQASANAGFSGPLAFLNTYEYTMGRSYLTGSGAATEFRAGTTFWSRYGRFLYDAVPGQVTWNYTVNGKPAKKPVLRTTGQSRIENSQINWALGFFGISFEETPYAAVNNLSDYFNVVIIPEGGTENNTLASYDSCINDNSNNIGYIGDSDVYLYIPIYLKDATARIQQYAPAGFTLTTNDTYAMQSICAYESAYFGIGMSEFCYLFTADEWAGFEYTLDIEYYFDYSFGQPTGRAQGIGYLQELLARLQKQYITSSNSSVNYTIDNNPKDFPLDEPFYADFTHDDIIISVLTAMSFDYLHDLPSLTTYPPPANRTFILSNLTPFGARLVTEVIGCTAPDPAPVQYRMQYYNTQYGYDESKATNKFIRMRLNNGILPISTIRGGKCDNGRPDGLCAMTDFIESQANAYALSNYDYACFANYTLANPTSGKDYDGTISAGMS